MSAYKPGRPIKYNPITKIDQKPPSKPGEYRIRDVFGTITYIGETNNLARRAGEYQHSDKLPVGNGQNNAIEYKVADGRSNSRTRGEHEREKIAQHQPLLNKSWEVLTRKLHDATSHSEKIWQTRSNYFTNKVEQRIE